MKTTEGNKTIISQDLIRYIILGYWSIFWLFNSLDKIIGGSEFLWVGKNRFAQVHKFFASTGLDSPIIANVSLVIISSLEIFACIFFIGAFFSFMKKNHEATRSWFGVGISLTLIIFTLFSIGDHIFGDRFELLEHSLFWIIALLSWVIFIRIEKVKFLQGSSLTKRQWIPATILLIVLVSASTTSIFKHNESSFIQRTEAVQAIQTGEDIYKVSFPFLGGSTAFEKSIKKFKDEHPEKRINHVYTVPDPLKLKKADALIFYIITEDKK